MAAQQKRTFAADRREVPVVRHWVIALAEQASFSKAAPELALAVTEAASNAVRHSGSRSMTVVWRVEDDQAIVELSDEGTYDEQVGSPHQVSGLGLPLMTSVMDEVAILRGGQKRPGTRVRLVKRKPEAH